MKFSIFKDERWPDYGLASLGCGHEVEVSDELRERYEKSSREYDAIQDELKKLYEAARDTK